ncbi:MAG: hypothetical protein IJI83_07105 [Oscillospiraceae bacterium]|nr:hypothetical protein [Erysipelotrichaceae bacterium]MBQ6149290.1 hypothetical protein [Oscillospiraceae bacterium]MBQ6494098.1 hypothetical protein [Erysipelotrichaceae bacterium]
MKKILSVLLVAMMLAIMPATVFADGDTNEVTGDSATVELEASMTSSYRVRLPKKVDVSDATKTFDVYVCGDIAASEELVIAYTNNETLYLHDTVTGSSKADVPLNISVSGNTFAHNVLPATYDTAKATFTVTHNALQAGRYSAIMPVTITLRTVTA